MPNQKRLSEINSESDVNSVTCDNDEQDDDNYDNVIPMKGSHEVAAFVMNLVVIANCSINASAVQHVIMQNALIKIMAIFVIILLIAKCVW